MIHLPPPTAGQLGINAGPRIGEGAPAAADSPAAVYIHIPFCTHICPYCDFNTYAQQQSLIPRYLAAVEREIVGTAPLLDKRKVATVFVGGGTPSLLSPKQVAQLIDVCRSSLDLAANAEITLEANPNNVDEPYFVGILAAGVNRLSIGAQTLSPRGLRTLGRLHEAVDVGNALAASRRAGFANVSVDLIFGWPGQTLESWRADLAAILGATHGGIVPDHLSLYSLIVEPGTAMADAVARGILTPVDDDASADFYELAIDRLDAAGWLHYEIANWASAPAFVSRHNRVYWRNGDYLGIGAGAHGHVAGTRWMNHPLPISYCAAVESGRGARSNTERIGTATAMGETMMLGLRLLADGVVESDFLNRHGRSIQEAFGSTIHELAEIGLLHVGDGRVRLTRRGLMLANDVCARFV